MKIILSKDVQNLGEEGDIREVARGYARNYLIPQGLGVAYTKQNLALLEGRKKAIEQRKAEKRDRAKGLKERIEGLDITIQMTVGETGRLFGSVTNAMIAEELSKLGIEVERKRIEIPEHTIKTVGNFVVKVKLYGNEIASLKVTVEGPKGKTPAEAAETEGAEEAAASTEETEQAVEEAVAAEASEQVAEASADEEEAEVESGAQAEAAPESEVAEEPQSEAAGEPEVAEESSEPTAEAGAEAEAPSDEQSEETPAEEPEAQAETEPEASEESTAEDEESSDKE